MIDVITQYKLYGIRSSRYWREAIGFELLEGLQLYYKPEGIKLKGGITKRFNQAYKLKPNWYIFSDPQEAKNVIKLYKID